MKTHKVFEDLVGLLYLMKRTKNQSFQFKQFIVKQDRTAMKVCTEACILGSYVAVSEANKILDIGTGTGLLALMLAQRATKNAIIHAVEIDQEAFEQAQENIQNSPFASKIQVFHQAIQGFASHCAEQYDLIVSNPPFYQQHLRSANSKRNQALHAQTLTFSELSSAVTQLLAPTGTFVVLLPVFETQQLTELLSKQNLFPQQQLVIKNQADGGIFRLITAFGFKEKTIKSSELFIRDKTSEYSNEFVALLKDYYLIF